MKNENGEEQKKESEIIHIRIDKRIMKKVRALAKKNVRSYQNQIEYMLKTFKY